MGYEGVSQVAIYHNTIYNYLTRYLLPSSREFTINAPTDLECCYLFLLYFVFVAQILARIEFGDPNDR